MFMPMKGMLAACKVAAKAASKPKHSQGSAGAAPETPPPAQLPAGWDAVLRQTPSGRTYKSYAGPGGLAARSIREACQLAATKQVVPPTTPAESDVTPYADGSWCSAKVGSRIRKMSVSVHTKSPLRHCCRVKQVPMAGL